MTRALTRRSDGLAWDGWGDPGLGTLVLVHGYTGSAADFELNIDALLPLRRVVAVEQRGHGRSARAEAYSIGQLERELAAFLEGLGEPVDLLGHSLGGRVALGVALDRPELLRSLVLMDTSAQSFVNRAEPELAELRRRFIDDFDPAGGLPEVDLANPEDALVEAVTTAEFRAERLALLTSVDPYAVKQLGLQLFDDTVIDVRQRLGELALPVTVIVGSNDEPYASQADATVAAITGARLSVIDGAYHSPQLSHQREWHDAVTNHLAR